MHAPYTAVSMRHAPYTAVSMRQMRPYAALGDLNALLQQTYGVPTTRMAKR